MPVTNILNPVCCSGCGCNECECERGEKGKRGKRGKTGPIGPSGPPGPPGPAAVLEHVQASTMYVPLAPDAATTILTCAPISGPAGSYFQFTGMVNFTCLGKATSDSPLMAVVLKEDGVGLATSFATPGGRARPPVFDFLVNIPIAWWRVSDGLPHVYSVDVITDSNGSQQVQTCALFVNNVA